MSGNRVLAFGPFRLDVSARCLKRDGDIVALPPKAVDVLVLLAENQGKTVLKQELVDTVWAGTFVEEGNVAQSISLLRKALGDNTQDQRWIKTIPKRGYCFIAPVQPATEAVEGAHPRRFRWAAAGVAALLAAAVAVVVYPRRQPAVRPVTRVLVLPVENLSGDPAHDYVSDGLTEELIAQLSALEAERVAVIARTSSMAYKGTHKSLEQIAQELHVDYVVESSLRWSGNRLRITSQLVRTKDQSHVWSNSYERTAADMLALEDEVARAVSLQVDAKLAGRPRVRQPAPQAYLAYLEGRYYWNKRTRDAVERAIADLQHAVAIDPSFARAHAALAEAYMSLGLLTGGTPSDLFARANGEILAALSLDENLAEAHTSLAYLKFWQEWDWAGADAEFRKAIALNPDDATAHQWYAEYLRLMGRYDESLRETDKALELDPLSLVINMEAGLPYYFRGQTAEAEARFRRAIELDPNFALAYVELGWTYEQSGRMAEALRALETAAKLDDTSAVLSSLGRAYAVAGQTDKARRIAAELEQRSHRTYVSPFLRADLYLGLGERSRALDLLEQAYREHDWGLVWLKAARTFDVVRSDPRFLDLMRRMNFPATKA